MVFVFYRNNRLVLLQILSYRESTVAALISSIKFYFHSWPAEVMIENNTDSILKSNISGSLYG